jgi:bacterioferritin-associated ferredoxin
MVVCLCKNVSSRVIERHIADGAETLEEIGRRCGAGTECGGCRCELEDMLEQAECDRSCMRRSGEHHLPVLQPDANVA